MTQLSQTIFCYLVWDIFPQSYFVFRKLLYALLTGCDISQFMLSVPVKYCVSFHPEQNSWDWYCQLTVKILFRALSRPNKTKQASREQNKYLPVVFHPLFQDKDKTKKTIQKLDLLYIVFHEGCTRKYRSIAYEGLSLSAALFVKHNAQVIWSGNLSRKWAQLSVLLYIRQCGLLTMTWQRTHCLLYWGLILQRLFKQNTTRERSNSKQLKMFY